MVRTVVEAELFRSWCVLYLPRKMGRYLVKLSHKKYGLERAIFCLRGQQIDEWMAWRQSYINDRNIAFIADPSLRYRPWPLPDADARPDADA